MEKRTLFGYKSIQAQLDVIQENTKYDFEYDSGEILQTLFEDDTNILSQASFGSRMKIINEATDKTNSIFDELKQYLRKNEPNKEQ